MTGTADLAATATAFGEVLHDAGVPASVDQLGRFVRATALTAPATLDELYWLGRITLVADRSEIDAYDRAFGQIFRGLVDLADSRGDTSSPPERLRPAPNRHAPERAGAASPGGGAPVAGGREAGESEERDVDVAVASRAERLAATDFGELTDDELRHLRDLMRRIRLSVPLRPARRYHRHRHGDRLDLRATLRSSRRSGGDPIEHVTRMAGQRRRKLVVLCDISGSMAPYSRACIQLLHAAAEGSRAEVFTFATRLTRLTRALSGPDADLSLSVAASTAPDWNGGTRIGSGLKEFLDLFGRRGLARGAVVVIVSDGWDTDAPDLVGEQMARLGRLAHRIVWINPRRNAPGFAPLAGGMAAAYPFCDALVGGNNLNALGEAVDAIAGRAVTRPPPTPALSHVPPPDPPCT